MGDDANLLWIDLSDSEIARLKKLANLQGVSIDELVNQIIADHIDMHDRRDTSIAN